MVSIASMASNEIPQITAVGVQDDTLITPASHISDAFSLPRQRSPTFSAPSSSSVRWTLSRDKNSEVHDGLPSLGPLAPSSQGRRRQSSAETPSSIGSSFTGYDTLRSGRSHTLNTHPSSNNTHVDAVSDTSRLSSPAAFFKRIAQRVRHPSPSPSNDIEIGSDITRDNADVNRGRAELVHPLAARLASLFYPKNLQNLERFGGASGLLRSLGVDRHRGLNSQLRLRAPTMTNAVGFGTEMTLPKLDGLQSTASLGGAHEATIEDRQRLYGQNILTQRPSKSLLRLVWLALRGKVIVSPMISHSCPCIRYSRVIGCVIGRRRSIACPWPFPRFRHNPP